MRIAYFDCFSGVSGDMILGALLDVGLPVEELRSGLSLLKLQGFELKAAKVRKGPFTGTKVDVMVTEERPPHRHLSDILDILEQGDLDEGTKEDAKRIFTRLAEAEAKVHGTRIEEVHFHEVGAIDAIVDVVGAAFGLRRLGIERLYASPLNLGSGFVEGAHGRLPVPAPGTLELLKGIPAYSSGIEAELTTPTGAAILSTVASCFGPLPRMTIQKIGYGAGTRDLTEQPNLLRLITGEAREAFEEDQIAVLEANIDDMNPQFFEPLMERLFEAGAFDVSFTPIIMKKSRPAVKLTVLADRSLAESLSALVLSESTTFGVRIYEVQRRKLRRETIEVKTRFGLVRVKCGFLGEKLLTSSPEYEDCKQIALSQKIPIGEVYEEARRLAANPSRR